MDNSKIKYLLGGILIGSIIPFVVYFLTRNNDNVISGTNRSITTIDSITARRYSENYKQTIKDTCNFKFGINISKEQYEALDSTATILKRLNKYTEAKGFRLYYGYEEDNSGIIKSFAFTINNRMQAYSPGGNVLMVDLSDRRFTLPCPRFCD